MLCENFDGFILVLDNDLVLRNLCNLRAACLPKEAVQLKCRGVKGKNTESTL